MMYNEIVDIKKQGGVCTMKEQKSARVRGLKGFKSLTAMLICIIVIMISIPTIGLACLGIHYLAIKWRLNHKCRVHWLRYKGIMT